MIKRSIILSSIASIAFYFGCIHRSRELPKNCIEKGVKVVEEISSVNIDGYGVYNPGVVAFEDGYLMAYRVKANNFYHYLSLKWHRKRQNIIQVCEIDSYFHQKERSYKLLGGEDTQFSKITDPRLFYHQDKIFMIFCDHSNGGSVQTLCELIKEEGKWMTRNIVPLAYQGKKEFFEQKIVTPGVEKNWVPFSKGEDLYVVYLWEPQQVVLKVDIETGICKEVYKQESRFVDEFRFVRGGAPAIYDEQMGGFVHLYHVAHPGRNSYTTLKKNVYIAGAYLFDKSAPFSLINKTKGPFYQKDLYNNREKIIFPTACIAKKDHFLVFYGEDDVRIKVAKINKSTLLQNMKENTWK